jgi:tRNA splicing ligase
VPAGGTRLETLTDCLPRREKVTTREDVAGVDSLNFTRWAADFIAEVCDLTKNGRKVLLTYDGYRSHLCFKALSILRDGGVISYELPAHTSGKTQPLDVSIFSAFKSNLNDFIRSIGMTNSAITNDVFEFCKLVTEAYKQGFAEGIIKLAFQKTGIWPLNPQMLLYTPMPKSSSRGEHTSF